MFDANLIGNYIAFLRKNKKLTQYSLAEELGVSHQAVSNWERGEAMPDISLLQKIAKILDTTVDRILAAGESDDAEDEEKTLQNPHTVDLDTAVNEIVADTPDDAETNINGDEKDMNTNNIPDNVYAAGKEPGDGYERVLIPNNAGGFSEAFVLKAELKLKDDGQSLNPEAPTMQEADTPGTGEAKKPEEFDWKKICKLAPFASSETLDKFIRNIIANDGRERTAKISMKYVNRLAPFLHEDSLDLLVQHLNDTANYNGIVSLAPHLSEKTLDRLVSEIDLGNDFNKILALAPFLGTDALESLVEKIDGTASYDMIISLAPFLHSETVDRLILGSMKSPH